MSRHEDAVSLRQMLDHILWEIAATDFPPLAQQIRSLLSEGDGASPQDDGAAHG